jgi:SAM-dependent methyltransferase
VTSTEETFQVSLEAAEAYEAAFVPALFGEWAPHVVEAAGVRTGQRVLDVACGTGVVARTAANRVGPTGQVVGVDLNPAMLEVARRRRPDIEWRQGDAGALPLPDAAFDAVLCQAALMFFPDRAGALREMARVLDVGGTVAVQVWASLEEQPGYGPFVEVAARHAGPEAVDLLGSYWVLGDLDALGSLFESAGLDVTATRTLLGTAHFDSLDALVRTEVDGTPLGERIDEETYDRILVDTRAALAACVTAAGTADIPIRGHVLSARRQA